jgi:HlyD family secretion protein
MQLPRQRSITLSIGAILLCVTALIIYQNMTASPDWTTTTVERGSVNEVIGISGFVEAEDAAELSFPTSGLVTDVFVKKGDYVTKGQLLATLGSAQLVAERAAAVATLAEARAGRTELEAGPTSEARAVTEATLKAAETALAETIATEAEKVKTARAALLSNDLGALSIDSGEEAPAPTVSGSYTCRQEGTYTISIYRSSADSGYSFNVSGLESGTGAASTEQPGALGNCGLYLQFDADANYSDSTWIIAVPNIRSSTYTAYQNAYELALRQEEQNVTSARNTLAIAKNQATANNAAPRVESLIKATAAVQAAESRIAAIDAKIADASIMAPFDGIITNIAIVPGETANLAPVMTILGTSAFSLTARVPEIDITKIERGQHASVRFDAKTSETYTGEVHFVSPLPTTIDGVAYFDATIILKEQPAWLRAGLNADVDVTLRTEANVLKVPERYLTRTPEGATVLTPSGRDTTPVPVTVLFVGNDGFAVITGLNEGDVIVAPLN